VRLGTSLKSAYAVDDVRVGAQQMIERARASYAAGLDSLFVGDHHSTPAPYYQNTPMLGRLLAEWHDRTAGLLMLLPLWNPVLAAEQIGTLAAIHDGPFVLQCAIGGGNDQFGAMGVALRERPSRFEAALDTMRRLLAGETVDAEGPYLVERARIAPVPPDPVAVWIGASAPNAVDRAARLGDGFLVGPEATPEQVGGLIALYRERCEAHGRAPGTIAVRRDVHVGASADDAERVAGPIVRGGYRGFSTDAPVWGDVARVADAFTALGTLGATDVIVRHLVDDQREVLSSIERLSEVRGLVAAG
jgi:alkanesulfonate monooxygenase SsuD/methylene tetrahydromethanopterin reductase-like flavin-dependent oxidoreductase (luciferase family)